MSGSTSELMEPRERFVNLRGKRFHYLEWGDPTHPPLVLAHGGASSARGTWVLTAPAFADRFYIVAIDHRGHGESEWDKDARYSVADYADDLHAFVETLGLAPFFLVAHSLGGRISLMYAGQHGAMIRGLVLVDSGAFFAAPSGNRGNALSSRPLSFGSRDEAEAYARSMMPDVARNRSVGYGFIDRPDGTVTWRTDVVGMSRAWQSTDDAASEVATAFAKASFPILLLRAGASGGITLETVEKMKAANPAASIVTYERAYHWLHQDEPELFERDVAAFFAQAAGPVASTRAAGERR